MERNYAPIFIQHNHHECLFCSFKLTLLNGRKNASTGYTSFHPSPLLPFFLFLFPSLSPFLFHSLSPLPSPSFLLPFPPPLPFSLIPSPSPFLIPSPSSHLQYSSSSSALFSFFPYSLSSIAFQPFLFNFLLLSLPIALSSPSTIQTIPNCNARSYRQLCMHDGC